MDHRKALTRIVWHYNHGNRADAFRYAREAGYVYDTTTRFGDYDETRFTFEGQVVGFMHSFHGTDAEAFLFLFMPEATAGGWSRFWWRLKHPFAPLADLPWPNREGARHA